MPVSSEAGIKWAQQLAKREGIITGISGGSTFAIAVEIAEKAPDGSVILCMLPDTAERYMSSPLFESIESEMDAEEVNISKSTPGFQIPE
jgi:cysteine synthase A